MNQNVRSKIPFRILSQVTNNLTIFDFLMLLVQEDHPCESAILGWEPVATTTRPLTDFGENGIQIDFIWHNMAQLHSCSCILLRS